YGVAAGLVDRVVCDKGTAGTVGHCDEDARIGAGIDQVVQHLRRVVKAVEVVADADGIGIDHVPPDDSTGAGDNAEAAVVVDTVALCQAPGRDPNRVVVRDIIPGRARLHDHPGTIRLAVNRIAHEQTDAPAIHAVVAVVVMDQIAAGHDLIRHRTVKYHLYAVIIPVDLVTADLRIRSVNPDTLVGIVVHHIAADHRPGAGLVHPRIA